MNSSSKLGSQDGETRNEKGVGVKECLKTNKVSKVSEEGITRENEGS